MKILMLPVMVLVICLLATSVIAQRPNIVLILLDDANKSCLPPDAPVFVEVPNIERIYKEGALFTNFYAVDPLCNPARYSLLTGVYPHVHGAINNKTRVTNQSLPFFTSILQDAGYHNLCIGKYSNVDVDPPYFEKKMCIKKVDYTNPLFVVNGKQTTIMGNTTQIINDTMREWISKIDTPFFAWIGHIAPHDPTTAPEQDQTAYDDEIISMPVNADFFQNDYPSFLYSDATSYVTDTNKQERKIEKEYEALLEIDRGIGSLFDTLLKRGILDNTFLVLTNDNGVLNGEHYLLGKGKPYEPTSSLPLFIRYPKYFDAATSVVYYQLLQSFDLTPTFLSVAGIDPRPYHFQGLSLDKQLFGPKRQRSNVFFEKIQGPVDDDEELGEKNAPSWRAIRTLNYKYVIYRCDSLVEELFDMKNDSLETTNLVYNANYAATLQRMRKILNSRIVTTHDTLSSDTLIGDCFLMHHSEEKKLNSVPQFELSAYPQPASDYVNITWASREQMAESVNIRIELFNQIGIEIGSWNRSLKDGLEMTLDVRDLSGGLYFIRASADGPSQMIPLVIQ